MNSDFEILREEYNPVVPVGWFIEHTDMRTVAPHVATESDIWIVYDNYDEAIAMALVEISDSHDTPKLHRIGVRDTYRRQGIASALVEHLLDEYWGVLECECPADSDANAFYEATGWEQFAVHPGDPDLNAYRIEEDDDGA